MLFKKFLTSLVSLLLLPICLFATYTTLYVGNDGDNALLGYDTLTNTLTTLSSGAPLSAPRGLALSRDGTTLYIASFGNGELLAYNINSPGITQPTITGATLTGCYGLALGPDGNTLL